MTREERRREVKKNRLALAFIIIELIAVAILIPLAISRIGNKSGKNDVVNTDVADGTVMPGSNTQENIDKALEHRLCVLEVQVVLAHFLPW